MPKRPLFSLFPLVSLKQKAVIVEILPFFFVFLFGRFFLFLFFCLVFFFFRFENHKENRLCKRAEILDVGASQQTPACETEGKGGANKKEKEDGDRAANRGGSSSEEGGGTDRQGQTQAWRRSAALSHQAPSPRCPTSPWSRPAWAARKNERKRAEQASWGNATCRAVIDKKSDRLLR
jgi:hypothetical protein